MTRYGLIALVLAWTASAPAGQRSAGERVLFHSADQVELVGTFYPGSRKSPCVLLFHGVGERRSARAWQPLAQLLHQKGYAVLTFDFRGHGQSTTVDPDVFWAQAANRAGLRGAKDEEIDVASFHNRYWPVLVNDIAAAKALLDRKNDVGECNSANLILIGADSGATLGAVWLQAECFRYRQQPPAFLGALPQVAASPEVQHVLAALWLNIEPKLGARSLSLAKVLETAARRYRIPMVFVCDRDNPSAQRTADALEQSLKTSRQPHTGAVAIAVGGIERAEEMLVKHFPRKQLLDYLETVQEDQGNEWQDFESRQALFLWKSQRLPTYLPANRTGSNSLLFQTYESFLQ